MSTMLDKRQMQVLGRAFLWMCLLPAVLLSHFYPIHRAGAQSEVAIPVNIPATLSADVVPGMTSVDIPFTIDAFDSIRVEAIVPVENATFTLLDSFGLVVVASGDASLQFFPGSDVNPATSPPGGVFVTDEILGPEDGDWTVRIEFPAAPELTVVFVTVFSDTRFHAGIAIAGDAFLTDQDVSLGLLVLDDGLPVLGLSPDIVITHEGGSVVNAIGLDDGVEADGLAGDGLYSVTFAFPQAGTYTIEGAATIPTSNGDVERTATHSVQVTDPAVSLLSIAPNLILRPGGTCIERVDFDLLIDVQRAGVFIANLDLTDPLGQTVQDREEQTVALGPNLFTLSFPSQVIRAGLAEDGPYTVSAIRVLELADTLRLAFRDLEGDILIEKDLADFCAPPLELEAELQVDQILRDGFIEALELTFPVTVQVAGNYQISFTLAGSEGGSIPPVGVTRSLQVGRNDVTVSVPAASFLTSDGPYRMISLLVLGPAGADRLIRVGETGPLLRWQFFPTVTGDLNNDGAVDGQDIRIIVEQRDQPALSPGDRRDIDMSGVVEVPGDVPALTQLFCKQGACPQN